VDEVNARAIIDQWKAVHGIADQPERTDVVDGNEYLAWKTKEGGDAIEVYRISGMGHGTPIDASSGYGAPGPYMLNVEVSSAEQIARSWGLTPSFERRAKPEFANETTDQEPTCSPKVTNHIQDVIENALRSAGQMK
jgi:poly(3-hydroxybutyrate) depolymerase